MIAGGWAYVIAAYAVAGLALGGLALWVAARTRYWAKQARKLEQKP
jgi:heme exporter protein CcmD